MSKLLANHGVIRRTKRRGWAVPFVIRSPEERGVERGHTLTATGDRLATARMRLDERARRLEEESAAADWWDEL